MLGDVEVNHLTFLLGVALPLVARLCHHIENIQPTSLWAEQQIVEAFPWDEAPRYLLRDRDNVYGTEFRRRVPSLAIEEVLIPPRSPALTFTASSRSLPVLSNSLYHGRLSPKLRPLRVFG